MIFLIWSLNAYKLLRIVEATVKRNTKQCLTLHVLQKQGYPPSELWSQSNITLSRKRHLNWTMFSDTSCTELPFYKCDNLARTVLGSVRVSFYKGVFILWSFYNHRLKREETTHNLFTLKLYRAYCMRDFLDFQTTRLRVSLINHMGYRQTGTLKKSHGLVYLVC
jgi:hypothetical protein